MLVCAIQAISGFSQNSDKEAVIDSLRGTTLGFPVIIELDTLFYVYANKGGLLPESRVKQIEQTILSIGKSYHVEPDSLRLHVDEMFTDIVYEHKVIMSITDNDAIWMNTTREQLAEANKEKIKEALVILAKKYNMNQLIKHILLFILVIVIQGGLIVLTNYSFRKLNARVKKRRAKLLKPIYIKTYEFLSIKRQEKLVHSLLKFVKYIVIIIQLIISIPILFSIFPQTENFAMQLFSYILTPLKKMGSGIAHYIPNIFTIIVIFLVFRYIIKGIAYLAGEIGKERMKIPGFYADWARPTFNIIRFLLYAFMIVLIYPYLPNSESRIFQGISVFLGLIVSFGSSSAIGNLVAGMVITYMRPFVMHDRIKINDIVGNVIERTPIVTRILTIKNEIVTIPNSTIMNSQITNLSESARSKGLIAYLEVTFSYETPWRQIHQLLLDAAEMTDDVMKEPHPFVLEDAFDDFYVVYQINVYIRDADKLVQIKSNLRQHIQDKFKEAGISITSRHFHSVDKG
jgi:small-conductance mechanosensitive channel